MRQVLLAVLILAIVALGTSGVLFMLGGAAPKVPQPTATREALQSVQRGAERDRAPLPRQVR